MKARRPMDEKKETELKHSRLKSVMVELSKGKSGSLQKLKRLNVSPSQKEEPEAKSRSDCAIRFVLRHARPLRRGDLRFFITGQEND